MKSGKFISAFVFVFLFGLFYSQAQLITTDPLFPTDQDSVVITFNAILGNGDLEGYQGDVYAHTGVITSESSSGSDWKYVKTDWGQNTDDTKLTRIGDDLYTLKIAPSIRDYYGVPPNEDIYQMAFVFRSAEPVGGGYLEGKTEDWGDIFADVYEAGLYVYFEVPDQKAIIAKPEDTIAVKAAASYADSISLYLDDELISYTYDEILTDTIIVESFGKHWVKAIAANDTGMVADSFYYYVRDEVTIEELPDGIRNGINYIDDSTVILCLLAPGKEYVFTMGDFNNWETDDSGYMKMTPDGEKFWIEINNLTPGKEYIFQYFVDGEIKIADPYTEKISDPWNDKYITGETYPGLIEYPEGKTTGIASVLQTAQEEYSWQIENFVPADAEELVIYEMLIRDFTSQHTYQSLIDTLGYLERLGVTAIELMPINEFEGNSSWGYNPSFYFAPDKYYGPKNNLKKFIDECHSRNIAVIIDMVLNHSYDQSPFVQLYFDGDKPTEENPWYNREHNFTNPDAHWGNDFDHESEYTQQLVDSINSFWINEYKVDGFRFDFTKGIGNNIKGPDDPWGSNYDADRIALLKRMTDEIWKRNPNTIVIFEHLAENTEEKELADYGILLWGNLNHNYNEATMGYNSGGKSDFSWISYQKRGWQYPHVVGYMESHDEERLMYKNITYGNSSSNYNIKDTTIGLERIALASAFFIPVPGPKMIWQFGEMGYDYSIDYNGRLGPKPVRWDYYQDYRRKYLYDVFSSLIYLKNNFDVFRTDDYDLDVGGKMKQIQLNDPGMNVCIIGNFDVEEGSISAEFQHTGWWYDYFYGDSLNVTVDNKTITLQPGEYHIYTDVRLENPAIGTGTGTVHETNDSNLINSVYPNPFSDHFSIHINNPEEGHVIISLYDILGRKVYFAYDGFMNKGSHQISINIQNHISNVQSAGLFFLSVNANNDNHTVKLIRK